MSQFFLLFFHLGVALLPKVEIFSVTHLSSLALSVLAVQDV